MVWTQPHRSCDPQDSRDPRAPTTPKKKKTPTAAELASVTTVTRNVGHGLGNGLTIQPLAGMAGSVC